MNILQTKPFSPEELSKIALPYDSETSVRLPDIDEFGKTQQSLIGLKKSDTQYQLNLARAKRLIADECLVKTPENLFIVYSHAGFEAYWNCLAPEMREKVEIVRPYWFGICGARLDYRQAGARTKEEIEEFISSKLLESLKKEVNLYKEKAKVCNFYRDKVTGRMVPKDDTNYRQAFITEYNGVGLEYSTYKFALLRGLAGEAPLPEIPETSLSKTEYDELKKEFTPSKTKENK